MSQGRQSVRFGVAWVSLALLTTIAACGGAVRPTASSKPSTSPTGESSPTTAGTVQVPLSTFPSITVRVPAVTPPDEVVSDSNGERCLKPYEEITISPTGTPYQDFIFDLGTNNNGDPVVEDVAASNPAIGPQHILCYFPGERAEG